MKPEQQVEQAPKQQSEKSWITEASLLVPLVIFVVYIWSVCDQLGFHGYFSLPYYLISLNPTTVLTIPLQYYLMIAYILSLIFVVRVVIRFVEDASADKPARRFYLSLAVGCLPMLIILYQNYKVDKRLFYIVSALTVLTLIGILVFRKKLIAQHKRVQERRQANGLSIGRYLNDLITLLILIAVGSGPLWFIPQGRSRAENASAFHVVKQSLEGQVDSEVVVLGNYGDYLVAVPFKRDTNKFERKFVLLKMSDMAKIPLSLEKIGKLQPVKPEDAKPVAVKPSQ